MKMACLRQEISLCKWILKPRYLPKEKHNPVLKYFVFTCIVAFLSGFNCLFLPLWNEIPIPRWLLKEKLTCVLKYFVWLGF